MKTKFPPGWDEDRVRRVLQHYESQSDEEAAAEDRTALRRNKRTVMDVPLELVPIVRELIGQFETRAES